MKKLAFEYVLYKLIEWYKSAKGQLDNVSFNQSNDLSKLKVIKLHFFVSSVNSNKNSLLALFDNFYAMPYGHVESDLYNSITSLERYTIDTKILKINEEYIYNLDSSFTKLTLGYKNEIDEAIQSLNLENSSLITYSALDLVELSHNYFSWKFAFNNARQSQKYSEPIPSQLIKEEVKYFSLNS